jgi:hypothetical protein
LGRVYGGEHGHQLLASRNAIQACVKMDARTQVAQALAEWRMLCSPDKVVQLKVIASSLQRLGHGENRCYANAAGDKYRALSFRIRALRVVP